MRLTIEITNAEDMKWLESLPKDHQKSTMLQCITIGRIAIQNCNMNVSPTDKLQEMIQPVVQGVMDSIEKRFDKTMYVLGSTTDRLLETNRDVNQCVQKNTDALLDTMRQQSELTNMIVEPIQRKIADVDTNLNRLFSTNASSNVKGKLAEHIIEEQLQTAFPKYEVRNTSKDAQEADFHVATDFGEVLLEMKHYKTTVNKDQIHKFYRDIEKTGSRYAIFQSVHSGISGKRDLEWEVYGENKCIILYHGNATLEPKAIVFSFLFLKALAESGLWRQKDASDFIRVQNDTTRQMVEFYEHAAEELIQLQTRLVNMRNAIFEQKQEIAKSMDVLYKHSMDLELEYKAIIRKLYVDIKQVIGKQKTMLKTNCAHTRMSR
jgi:hypothetical protein